MKRSMRWITVGASVAIAAGMVVGYRIKSVNATQSTNAPPLYGRAAVIPTSPNTGGIPGRKFVKNASDLGVKLIPASQMKAPAPVVPHFVDLGGAIPIPGASLMTSITEWTGTIKNTTYLVVTGQMTQGGSVPSGPPEIVVAAKPDTVGATAVAHWTKFAEKGAPKLLSVSDAGVAQIGFPNGSTAKYNITTNTVVG